MAISEGIANFAGAVEATRSELGRVDSEIERLETERRQLEAAPPHNEAIVGLLTRGIEAEAATFEQQFAGYLAGTFLGPDGAAKIKASPPSLLRLDPEKLEPEEARVRAMRGIKPGLNEALLAYLLRAQLIAEIPALVDRLHPAGRNGMRSEDRQLELDRVSAELRTLHGERESLVNDLAAARAAVIR